MADVKLKECDIFETLSKANRKVTVAMHDGDDMGYDEKTLLFRLPLDMSPRAIERAKNFLKRATTPPPKAKADA